MTRVYSTTGGRWLDLVARDTDPGCGEHAHCVCGGLMAYTNRGLLVCQDCNMGAVADPTSWEPGVER